MNIAVADDPLDIRADRIRAHPAFRRAVLHYSETLLAWRQGPRLLNKIVASHARAHIVSYLFLLHCLADPTDPDDGPSYSKILALMDRDGDGGPRTLKTMLALLRLAGFVRLQRGTRDGRLRLYRPTEKMTGMLREWYARTLGCFDQLAGGDTHATRMRTDPDYLRHFFATAGRAYILGKIPVMECYPDIHSLYMLDGGFPVAAALVEASLKGFPQPTPGAIARRFGLSASQVRNVLKAADRHGLVRLSDDGKVGGCAPLIDEFGANVARELALYSMYLGIPV